MRFTAFILFVIISYSPSLAQDDQVALINEIVTALTGEQNKTQAPIYRNMKQVCSSQYFSCNRKGKLVGFDFQFANLNGYLPASITQLKDLEYINLEYNYLAGTIPEGISSMTNLEELTINGNFFEGALPADFDKLINKVAVDLSQNTIKTDNQKFIKNFNITNQFNLEGCRSPDSIFLDMAENFLDAVKPKKSPNKESEDEKAKDEGLEDEELEDEKFKVIQEMPRFPGCEKTDLSDAEKENCAKEKMLQFIYRNLRYPSIARENGVQGMAVVQFVVLQDGNVGYAKVVRDPGARCGNAALWIVNRMNFICDRWVPGAQDGEKVKVLYTLPIKFKLN